MQRPVLLLQQVAGVKAASAAAAAAGCGAAAAGVAAAERGHGLPVATESIGTGR